MSVSLFNNKLILTRPSTQLVVRYTLPVSGSPLMATLGTNGTNRATWLLSTPTISSSNSYTTYVPAGNIALDSIPLSNTRCGTPNYLNKSGIVAGTSNSVGSTVQGAIIAGSNNVIGGNGRVSITGINGAVFNSTPYSYRESTYWNGSPTHYSVASDISIIQRVMTDTTNLHLTSEGVGLLKMLGVQSGRKTTGVHHVTLIGESNSDFYMCKFTVIYSSLSGVYTMDSYIVESSFNTLGAATWTHTVNNVSDNILKIIPTGGDYWYARINSIYNNR